MNIFKKWYFQWLDMNKQLLLDDHIKQEMHKVLSEYNKEHLVRCWIEKHGKDSIHYTTFVSACASNSYLIDSLVDSIMRKQLK